MAETIPLGPNDFPVIIEIRDGETDDLLFCEEVPGPRSLTIPTFGRPVRVILTFPDGVSVESSYP